MRWIRLLPLFVLAAPAIGVQTGEQTRQEGILIGIEQQPSSVMPVGGIAKFEGGVMMPEGLSDQRIRVKMTTPDGRVETFFVAHDRIGNFRLDIPNLRAGVYRLDFTGIDGRNTVQREFRVEDPVYIQDVLRKKKILLEMVRRQAERASQRVDSLPDGPSRAEAQQRVRRVRDDHRRVSEAVDRIFAAAEGFRQLSTAPPEVQQPAMEVIGDLSTWAQSTDQEEAELRAFEERTRGSSTTCDGLENASEALKFLGSITALFLKPVDTIKAALTDKLKDEVVERAKAARPPQPGQPAAPANPASQDIKFVIDRMKAEVEAARSGGVDGMMRTIPTQARETSVFIIDHLFTAYCSVIEGDAKAEFQVYHPEGGKVFYRYKLFLEAKLKLWADKSQAATPQGIPYSGRLEGSAVKVEFQADPFTVEKLPRGSQLVAMKVIPAPTLSKANSNVVGSGQVMRTLTPGHFNARYTGLLTEQGLKLKQEQVVDDFGPLFVNRVAIIAILPGGLIPGVTTLNFPMQKGCWIYDRGTKGPFEIPVQRVGEQMMFKKDAVRNETVGTGIKVDWKLTYDLKGKRPTPGS